MSSPFENLQAAVAAIDTVTESAAHLIAGVAQRIRDLLHQPDELQRLADDLNAHATSLAAAVAENSEFTAPQPVQPPAEPSMGDDTLSGTETGLVNEGTAGGDGPVPDVSAGGSGGAAPATGSDTASADGGPVMTIGGAGGSDVIGEATAPG